MVGAKCMVCELCLNKTVFKKVCLFLEESENVKQFPQIPVSIKTNFCCLYLFSFLLQICWFLPDMRLPDILLKFTFGQLHLTQYLPNHNQTSKYRDSQEKLHNMNCTRAKKVQFELLVNDNGNIMSSTEIISE